MLTFSLNYWPVLIAVVVNMAVGAIWYSPALFGTAWSNLLGQKPKDMMKRATPGYTVSAVGAIVQSFILANLVRDVSAQTAGDGLLLGLLLWLGFTAATTVSDTVFAGRPWKLWQINTGYYLVVLLINGAILATWR